MSKYTKITNFLFELGSLRRVVRNSYQTLGPGGENVAEHCFRTAVIGFCLASLEKVDIEKVVLMCVFHDMEETRAGDQNSVNARYTKILEEEVLKEQTAGLSFSDSLRKIVREYKERKTKESIVAEDADVLEQLLMEKEYKEIGNIHTDKWREYSLPRLKTKSAKAIAEEIHRGDSKNWWWPLLSKENIRDGKHGMRL